jgi:prevent-host-death family protein
MATSGIRELRQRASELLRRVEAGETIQITDRGRPVAVLAPLPDEGPSAQLRVTGDLVAAERDLASLPAPAPLAPGQERPSRILERLRHDER